MTFNEFNSKLNLPEICRSKGVTGLSFVKLPRFGWFGYNHNLSVVINIFDLFTLREIPDIFRYFTLENRQFQELAMPYSERSEVKFYRSYYQHVNAVKAFEEACAAFRTAPIRYDKSDETMQRIAKQKGWDALDKLAIGMLTPRVQQKHAIFGEQAKMESKHVVASFVSPRHLCAIHAWDIEKPAEPGQCFYQNLESGWFGTLKNRIAANLEDVLLNGGCTWDYKCRYWVKHIQQLSPELTNSQHVKIWSEGDDTQFDPSPLDCLTPELTRVELLTSLKDLTMNQVLELQRKTRLPLIKAWDRQNRQEVQIDGHTFIYKNRQYFMKRVDPEAELSEFTDFAIQFKRVVKDENGFTHYGSLFYQDREIEMALPEVCFATATTFQQSIRAYFLQHGIGIPFILTRHSGYLMNVIQKFSGPVPIESKNNSLDVPNEKNPLQGVGVKERAPTEAGARPQLTSTTS